MLVADAIRTKRAVRQFTDQPVSDEIIRAILNAGRRSQSSRNEQPWTFIVIRDRETLRQLGACGQYAGHLAGAAFAVALVSSSGNRFDLGQAAAYMQLAAWELGVGSCIASMWEPERAKAILGVPAAYTFDTALSFGYAATTPAPVNKPGGRRELAEVVRWERW
jgi:nitroreductase